MKSVTERSHGECDSAVLERPRYYPRQIITPGEMTLEQTYFRDRMRRHNRLLHGWGVVCGAEVCAPARKNGGAPDPWTITVKPGYVLGPYGDEIVIDCARTWDVRTGGPSGVTGEPPLDGPDPWCSVIVQEQEGPVYIAVKYKEILTRPVRVAPVGCGCDENQCVYSRWRDGYELGALAEPPESHIPPPGSGGSQQYATTSTGQSYTETPAAGSSTTCPQCAPCPSDPWVVLARVEFADDGTIVSISNCGYRRIVVSHASEWRTCQDDLSQASVRSGGRGAVRVRTGGQRTARKGAGCRAGSCEPGCSSAGASRGNAGASARQGTEPPPRAIRKTKRGTASIGSIDRHHRQVTRRVLRAL